MTQENRLDKPKITIIQSTDDGQIAVLWTYNEEFEESMVIAKVSDEMVQIRADNIAAERVKARNSMDGGE